MNDRWTDLLSPYVDGELGADERRELESHVETCSECAETLDSLRALVSRARDLRERDKAAGMSADLWPGIEARIRDLPVSTVRPLPRGGRPQRAGTWAGGFAWTDILSFPGLAAIAAALLIATGVAFYQFGWVEGFKHGGGGGTGRARVPALQASTDAGAEAALADVNRLKETLRRRGNRIDADTYRTLDESLGSVETAVDEAARALAADPGNPYIQAHLQELRTRQLSLLRQGVALADGTE